MADYEATIRITNFEQLKESAEILVKNGYPNDKIFQFISRNIEYTISKNS